MRRNWRVIAVFSVFVVTVGAIASRATPNHFLRGVIVGVVLATVPSVIWSWTIQITGTAPIMMGDQAEQWSAQELRKLRRQGWRVVNHFLLRHDDIDHVLIGPGGVWAVETKWSKSWDTGFARDREHEAVTQARSSARSMTLWDPIRRRGLQVRPVVVLWGGGPHAWAESERVRVIDGVPVVAGLALDEWTDALPADVLDHDGVDEVWSVVEAQASRRDHRDRQAHPLPTSFGRYLARVGEAALGAYAALLTISQVLHHTHAILWLVGLSLVSLIIAGAVLRSTRLRLLHPATWGWAGAMFLALGSALVLEVLAARH